MKPVFKYQEDGKKVVNNLLRFNQAESVREQMKTIETTLNSGAKLEERGLLIRETGRLKKQLQDFCPEPLNDIEKDANAIKIKELEAEFVPSMPTQEEMRRNPAHVVHNNIQWNKAYKERVLEWKNRMLQQNPESEDPDLCNIEGLRPSRPFGLNTTSQIPGHHAFSEPSKENFQEALPNSPTITTALEQVKAGKNGKRQATPGQLAHYARVKEAAKARRDAKASEATAAALGG